LALLAALPTAYEPDSRFSFSVVCFPFLKPDSHAGRKRKKTVCVGCCRSLPGILSAIAVACSFGIGCCRSLPPVAVPCRAAEMLSLPGSDRKVIAGKPVHLLFPLEHLPGKISKSVAIGRAPNREDWLALESVP
jgi:hypothetical protein